MTTSDVNTDALRRSHGDKYDALRECNETRASVLLSKLLIFGSFFPFLIVFCCIGDCCILRPNNFNPTLLRAAKDYSYWPEVFPRLPLAEKRLRLVGVSLNFFAFVCQAAVQYKCNAAFLYVKIKVIKCRINDVRTGQK